ncbi:hypothetical protein PMAYCL1PPCAC_17755, partial [Pristionchus mayeri]
MIYRLPLLFSVLVGLTLACAPNVPLHPNLDPSKLPPSLSPLIPSSLQIEGSGQAVEEATETATEASTESPVEETTETEVELLKEGPAPHQVITQLSQEFRESMKDWAGIVGKLGEAAQNLMRVRSNGVQNSPGEDEEFFRSQAASHFRQRVSQNIPDSNEFSISVRPI